MKIIFFILAASLAIALATPAPEAEADPQYDLSETFMDNYDEMDVFTDEALDDVELRQRRLCCQRPWIRSCRRFPRRLCRPGPFGK